MSIAGNLRTMELSELLQWAASSQKSGTLIIDNGRVQKRITFQNGRIISTASSDPEEHLGHFLVSRGYISEDELSKAMEMQATSKMLLGKILTTIGAISEPDLNKLLRLKAEESICNLFTWPEGEFRFVDDELPTRAMLPIQLDVTAVVLQGARRVDEWKRIRTNIPSDECIPVATGDLLDDSQLEDGARRILELVDDERTVEEIRIQTHSTRFHVLRVLNQQINRGRLKVIRLRGSQRAEDDDAAAAPQLSKDVDAKSLVRKAQTHLEQAEYDAALRSLRAARSLAPDNSHIRDAELAAENQIRKNLQSLGIVADAVPQLKRDLDELTNAPISPQEGFILSRINGSYDIQSISKISPMPEVETLLVFRKLLDSGYIRFK